jgi:hypothetical protein
MLAICAGAVGPSLQELLGRRHALLRAALPLVFLLYGGYAVAEAFCHPFGVSNFPAASLARRPDPLESWNLQLTVARGMENSPLPASGVLMDDSYLAIALQRLKSRFRPVMIWSPEAAFVFDPTLAPLEVRRRLRESNIQFVSISPGTTNVVFLSTVPFYRDDSRNWSQAIVTKGGDESHILYLLPPAD